MDSEAAQIGFAQGGRASELRKMGLRLIRTRLGLKISSGGPHQPWTPQLFAPKYGTLNRNILQMFSYLVADFKRSQNMGRRSGKCSTDHFLLRTAICMCGIKAVTQINFRTDLM